MLILLLLLLGGSHDTIAVRHAWHVGCASAVLLVLLLHEHLMSLLDQRVVLHVLLVHVEVVVTILVSWEIHVLILEIDDVQMVVLIYDLPLLLMFSTLTSLVPAISTILIFWFKAAFLIRSFRKLLF